MFRRELLVAAVLASGCLRPQGGGSTQSPNAAFSYSPTDPTVGEAVTFDASPSTAPTGEIVGYSWVIPDRNDEVDRQLGTGERISHAFDSAGDHRIGLRISLSDGDTARTAQTVTVTGR